MILDDVFVPDERVLADRAHSVVDPPLQVIVTIAFPIISGVYLGIADSAHEHAISAATGRAGDPGVHRAVGRLAAHEF